MKKFIFYSLILIAAIGLLSCGDANKPPYNGTLRIQPGGGHTVYNGWDSAVTVYLFWEVYSFDGDDLPLNNMEIQVNTLNAVGQASDENGNLQSFGTGALIQFLDDGNNPVSAPFTFKTDGRGFYRLGALVYLPGTDVLVSSFGSDILFSAEAYNMYVSTAFTWQAVSDSSSSKEEVVGDGVVVDPADYGVEIEE